MCRRRAPPPRCANRRAARLFPPAVSATGVAARLQPFGFKQPRASAIVVLYTRRAGLPRGPRKSLEPAELRGTLASLILVLKIRELLRSTPERSLLNSMISDICNFTNKTPVSIKHPSLIYSIHQIYDQHNKDDMPTA